MNRCHGLSCQLSGGNGNYLDLGMICKEAQELPTGVARTTDNSYIYHKIPHELMI